jgi:DNA polymerase-3 subunit epsilon
MTLLLGLDLETSQLEAKDGKILEIGYVLKRVGEPRPWLLRSEFIYQSSWGNDFIPKEASLINGIHPDHCKRFGRPLATVAKEINSLIKTHKVDYIVTHNGVSFDMPFLLHHITDLSVDCWEDIKATPVLDTILHVEYPAHIKARTLSHLAADHGFLNPFPHSALSDVLTTMILLEKYDIKKVIANAKEKRAIYKADVGYENREKAKALGFRWEECGGKKFPKSWVKMLRESELEDHVARLGFSITKME